MFRTYSLLLLAAATAFGAVPASLLAAEMSTEDAWKALPKYEPGQDMAGLLTIDREVIAAMKAPETRAACAAKLAELLAKEDTTLTAKQYICLQLRQVGTEAEVRLLERLLEDPETTEMSRYALESIPGFLATATLRAGLTKLQGRQLVGVIGSVAKRKDVASVAELKKLADSDDPQIATAAIRALGNIACGTARHDLLDRAKKAGVPAPRVLAVALLKYAASGQLAEEIYAELSQPGQPAATRRAALEGLLGLRGNESEGTVLEWFSSEDADRHRIAAGHLQQLPDEQLDKLLAQLTELPDAGKLAVIELAATRRGADMLPTIMSFVESSNADLQQAGIRCLGMIGSAAAIPKLIELLGPGGDVAEAAQAALASLPRQQVAPALLEALQKRPGMRTPIIDVLIDIKCYDAIDPLVEIAAAADPNEYNSALFGLRGIADPDKTDIPRLVKLLLRSEGGKHRDEVEKTILIVCDKLPAGADRSQLVLASLAAVDKSEAPKYLPVLGRLGGEASMKKIEAALGSSDPAIREAAVRALCNWPDAEVADKLLRVATDSDNRGHRRMALRAYIRVVSLKSDRPEAETLAMLQNAFQLASGVDEKRLAIERAGAVRTMEAVAWIAKSLDDAELAQAACGSIVELAHHRFLRHPNMKTFGPILERVVEISDDSAIVERAKRYRLGL
jgi:HEAT repeat protein